jgi:hypothetical protein
MSSKEINKKTDFIRIMLSNAEQDSSNKTNAIEYLSSQGLDVDSIVSDGLKKIKKIQIKIQAQKTKEEMALAEQVKQKASEWVDQLLNGVDFSLIDLVKEEELTISFRNMESLSKEDLKNILIKHFTLKFAEEQKKKPQ